MIESRVYREKSRIIIRVYLRKHIVTLFLHDGGI